MYRLKFMLLLIVLAYGHAIFAQADFEEVDSTTYQQYMHKQWTPLIKYGKKAVQHGYDYYYLNMRMGIAYYNRFNYNKGKPFFKKALHNDSYSDDAKEYLFWTDFLTGNERDAADTYKTLSDEAKARIKFKPKKLLESIYMEGGIKISDKTSVANHIGYAQLGMNHQFSAAFSIYHAFTYQQQKLAWGSYRQYQYYFSPSVKFKKHLRLDFNFHYAHYSSTINFTDYKQDPPPRRPPFPPPPIFKDSLGHHFINKYGNYKEDILFSQITVSKTIKGFTIEPHVGLFLSFQNPDFIDAHRDSFLVTYHIGPRNGNGPKDSTIISVYPTVVNMHNTKSTYYQVMFGTGLQYNFGRVTIGADVTAIFGDSVKTAVVTPWINIIVSKKINLSGFFTYKGNYPTALFEASQLYNSFDKIKYKASLTGEFYVAKKVNLYLTYQFEGIKDSFSNQDYNLHTLLIGLKLKL